MLENSSEKRALERPIVGRQPAYGRSVMSPHLAIPAWKFRQTFLGRYDAPKLSFQ
jgi:hypothetical protein